MLFRSPGTEAQKIQGYFSQLPELKHFRFYVRGEQPATQPTRPTPTRNPQGNI